MMLYQDRALGVAEYYLVVYINNGACIALHLVYLQAASLSQNRNYPSIDQ